MEISLFGIGQFGKSQGVTAQERLNCYLEIQPGDDRSKVAIYGTPGLDLFTSFGDTPVRGLHQNRNFMYVVHRGTFYEVNNAGIKIARGAIGTTSGRVYMADNGTQLMITDGILGYVYNFSTLAFVQITNVNYPSAGTVAWQDGYFIINKPNTQRFYVSAINDATTWAALDFSSAEANPDDIVSINCDNGNLYLFGTSTTEFWTNSGAQDFPYTRTSAGSTEWGCAAVNTIVKYDNTLAFLAKNRMGQVIVARMNGYLPLRISTPELEYIINNYLAVSDATSFSYMLGGHPMLQINFPTGNASWIYDGLSNCWSKVQGYQIGRHRAEIGVSYLEKIIVSDYTNGNLYRLNPLTYTDNGSPIVMELITRHVEKDDKRITIDKLQLDMEAGVGLANNQGSNPQIMMTVSKDGGQTYGTEQWATFGAIGTFKTRVIWRRLGMARDWTFKFRITDPVKRVIFGSSVEMRQTKS